MQANEYYLVAIKYTRESLQESIAQARCRVLWEGNREEEPWSRTRNSVIVLRVGLLIGLLLIFLYVASRAPDGVSAREEGAALVVSKSIHEGGTAEPVYALLVRIARRDGSHAEVTVVVDEARWRGIAEGQTLWAAYQTDAQGSILEIIVIRGTESTP